MASYRLSLVLDRRPQLLVVLVRPDDAPGPALPVVVERFDLQRPARAVCMGGAQECERGECKHVLVVAAVIADCKPGARTDDEVHTAHHAVMVHAGRNGHS